MTHNSTVKTLKLEHPSGKLQYYIVIGKDSTDKKVIICTGEKRVQEVEDMLKEERKQIKLPLEEQPKK